MTFSRERPLLVTISLVHISAGQPHHLEPGALQCFSGFFTSSFRRGFPPQTTVSAAPGSSELFHSTFQLYDSTHLPAFFCLLSNHPELMG